MKMKSIEDEPAIEGEFLDAKTLKIGEEHRCALIKALAYLEAGRLKEHSIRFNMKRWNEEYTISRFFGKSCGSVCCIGGSAEVLADLPETSLGFLSHSVPELRYLFYPGDHFGDPLRAEKHWGWKATQKQAATVLRQYLTTGNGKWPDQRP